MQQDKAVLLRFFRFLRPYRWSMVLGMGCIPLSTGLSLLTPWLLVHTIDEYIVPGKANGLLLMSGLFALCVLANYAADTVYAFCIQKAGLNALYDMRKALFAHILHLPRRYFDRHPVGTLISRITNDFESISESLASGVLAIFTDLLKTAALFAFMFTLSPQLALIVAVVLTIAISTIFILNRRLRSCYNFARRFLASSTGYLQECLQGVKTVQLFAAEAKAARVYQQSCWRYLKAQSRSNVYDAFLFSFIEGITWISISLVIWFGLGLNLENSITLGTLVGFVAVLQKVFVPIREFAQQTATIQRSLSAIEHIDMLLQKKTEDLLQKQPSGAEQGLGAFDEVRFEGVSFRYSADQPYVLQDVSFCWKRHQRLALVGDTGSGKTTIVRLIAKQYSGYEGSITLNGRELSDISRTEINAMFAVMQQDSFLFPESIGFNIGLERTGIAAEQIAAAARYVQADSFIEQLPGGFDFQLEGNGSNLSAGQCQLIAFARAIAGNNEVMLLDEATSAVDSITEKKIDQAIERVFAEKTVLSIAHRLSTIEHSDMILVLRTGSIVERGNHRQLLAAGGHYLELHKALVREKNGEGKGSAAPSSRPKAS